MGISITQLLIVLAIVILLFGTKKLRNIGSDLGGAIKTFKKSIKDDENEKADGDPDKLSAQKSERIIEGEVSSQGSPQVSSQDKSKDESKEEKKV